MKLTPSQVGEFYMQDVTKPYYEQLIKCISSGPFVALVLSKQNAVLSWRNLMGTKYDVYNSNNKT